MSVKAQQMILSMSVEEIAVVYRSVFGGWNGEMVLEHLKIGAHYYAPTFDETSINPNAKDIAILNEGKRATVMSIETMMGIMPVPKTKEEGNGE